MNEEEPTNIQNEAMSLNQVTKANTQQNTTDL